MTVSVPSVDSAYSAESTDGTLTKSATKTVLFQYSKIRNIPISGAGAAGVVFRDTLLSSAYSVRLRGCGVIRQILIWRLL